MKYLKRRKYLWAGMAALQAAMIAGMLSGCAGTTPGQENFVIVEKEEEPVDYKLVSVTVGDVEKTKVVSCTYSQLDAQRLSFAISGKRVLKVYVHEGDTVKKGDLLAELSGADKDEEIQNLEYRIKRNKLLLEQLDINEQNEISRRWLEFQEGVARQSYYAQTQITGDGTYVTNSVTDYQRNNYYTRDELTDTIALDQQQLNMLKTEAKQSRMYAEKEGTVSTIKKRLEGSTSVADEVVIEIVDSSECVFLVKNMEYADCVKEGQELDMSIQSGTSAGKYKVVPYEKDQWEDAMSFVISEGGDNVIIEAGTNGSIRVVLESASQVLTLPSQAIHVADGKYFVYVIGAEDVREVKWIETGIIGNDTVEITGGLSEGEKVILK